MSGAPRHGRGMGKKATRPARSRPDVRLIHWHAAEARERAAWLGAAGYRVCADPFTPAALRALGDRPPAAVVLDLTRGPARGRDLGLALRTRKATRQIPLVFAGGDPETVARVRELLPDAVYASWERIRGALARAIAHPPVAPRVPSSVFAAYEGTPVARKLGIKPGAVVALLGAPPGFEKRVGELPAGAAFRRAGRGGHDLALWFPRSVRDLVRRARSVAPLAEPGGLWIVWRKQASKPVTDVTQYAARRVGLATGLVDYKVCSIDATWSGLKFAPRRRR